MESPGGRSSVRGGGLRKGRELQQNFESRAEGGLRLRPTPADVGLSSKRL